MNDTFERAVHAVIDGDADALRALLAAEPDLATARSPKEHRGTLLHYWAANGVEDDLQRVPENAVEIARVLLDAGADADATCEIYGGGPGTSVLCSLVTSTFPDGAGLHAPMIEVLCKRGGARPDGLDDDGLPMAYALGFWYPKAGRALADCGARIDNAVIAAAVGDAGLMRAFFAGEREARYANCFELADTPARVRAECLAFAVLGGHYELAVEVLDEGVSASATTRCNVHGCETSPLHLAVMQGDTRLTELLLERGADTHRLDSAWEGSPAGWARHAGHEDLAELIEAQSPPNK